jgi:putative membrane protein
MRRPGLSWIAFAALTLIVGGCSNTPEQPIASGVGVGTGGAAADATSDAEFVRDVAAMNMAEIELSRIALQRATSPEIKAFAQRLINDHGEAGNKLKSVVSGAWPAQLDDEQRDVADKLATKQGGDFDREYTELMVESHQDLAGRLESRLDVQSLADWKTAAAGRAQTAALPEPTAQTPAAAVRPNASDDELTMKINRWAAETYPIAQKHLDTARALENAAKKRSTN